MGSYVPQAVVKDGAVLDVDLVLAEVVEDGELLLVEFSTGPIAFTTRHAPCATVAQDRHALSACNRKPALAPAP